MNILFLYCNVIAPSKGGVESWTAAMCEEFERRGHVCFYLAAKPVWKEFADPKRQYFLPDEKKFASSENANFFESLLREKHIDRILYLWADGKRFPFAEICQKSSIPVIAAIRTDPEFYLLRFRGKGLLQRVKRLLRFRRQSKIYRANANCCAVTVLLSKRVFSGFLRHFPNENYPGLLIAIPNNCRLPREKVDFSSKKKELLFVGRMEMAVKQPHLLLQIWQNLQDRFPDWTLRLVGGGDNVEEVKALARSLGLKNVFFEGFKEPAPYYRLASIFCMTSAYEGFPNVLLEAANYGCVPVAFDSFGAVQDIIDDGVSGILVPPFDLRCYADALSKLMLDPSLRVSLGSSALKNISRFSIEKIGDEWEELFRNLNINQKEIATCQKRPYQEKHGDYPPPVALRLYLMEQIIFCSFIVMRSRRVKVVWKDGRRQYVRNSSDVGTHVSILRRRQYGRNLQIRSVNISYQTKRSSLPPKTQTSLRGS